MKLTSYDFKKLKERYEITDLDITLIELFQVLKHTPSTSIEDSILAIVIDKIRLQESKRQVRVIQDKIWELGSMQLLRLIINQTPLDLSYFQDNSEPLILNRELLSKYFSSNTKLKKDDPRTEFAKKLGIDVVL